jgi:PAS domain S-box-containing protein
VPKIKNEAGWKGALGRNKLSSLVENMLDGLAFSKILFDSEGRPVDFVFLEVNEAFEQLTGLKRELILGKPVTEVFPDIEKDPADWIGIYGKVALRGVPMKFENYSEALEKWFGVSAYSPEKGYFVASFEDITARKKAAEEIARLASFPDLNPNPVVEVNFDGVVEYANPATELLFSDFKKSGLNHPFFSDWDYIVKTLNELRNFGRQIEIKGHWYHQQFSIPPKTHCIRIYAVNIDPMKQAEDALRESEQRWATTLASIGDAVIATDVTGKITFMNGVAEKLTGWTLNEAAQKPIKKVFIIINEQTRRKVADPVKIVLEKGVVVGLANHTILVRKNGTETAIDDSGAPIKDKAGRIVGVVLVFRDITERKKAEDTLRSSEQLMRFHVENSPLAVVEWDSDFVVTRWAGEAEKIFGWSASEVVGIRIADCKIIYEPDIPIVQATMTKLTNGVTRQVVSSNRNLTKDGKILDCTWYNSVLLDEHGKMKSVLSLVLDNTEHKKAEAKMQQQNAILEGINKIFEEALSNRGETELGKVCLSVAEEITQSKFGFIGEINPKGLEDIAISNPGWEACNIIDSAGHRRSLSNFDIHGIYGRPLKEGKTLITNDPRNHPDIIGTPRGHPLLKSFLGVPLIREGVTIGLIAVGNREGGYTKNEMESLEGLALAIVEAFMRKRAEKALFSTMEYLHLAHDVAKSGIWEWDLKTNENIWSEELWKLYGLKPHSVQPSYEAWQPTVHPSDLAVVERAVQEAARNGTDLNTEWRVRSPNKTERWLMSRGRPFRDANGQVTRLIGIVLDITERKQIEKKLEEYTKHLEDLVEERTRQLNDVERLTAIGETAGMVGHDLRNPLQTISGETYLAKTELEQLPDSSTRKNLEEIVQIITDQISYMDKIVSDLQDFVRPIKPDTAPLNLQKLLNETLAGIAIPKNIKVPKRIISNIPEVWADAQLLKRVFINLVINSIQAMPNGGTLTTKAHKKQSSKGNEKILISFEDTGVGIPEEIKSKIFKPLFTTKSRGQGFGLAVCKRVVEAHGGVITFESKEGKGTRFTVELPISKPQTTKN